MSLSNNFNVTLSTDSNAPTTLFDQAVDGGPCMTCLVTNRASSGGYARVHVAGLHPAGYWAAIAPGQTVPLRYGMISAISQVVAYGSAAGTIVDTSIEAKI